MEEDRMSLNDMASRQILPLKVYALYLFSKKRGLVSEGRVKDPFLQRRINTISTNNRNNIARKMEELLTRLIEYNKLIREAGEKRTEAEQQLRSILGDCARKDGVIELPISDEWTRRISSAEDPEEREALKKAAVREGSINVEIMNYDDDRRRYLAVESIRWDDEDGVVLVSGYDEDTMDAVTVPLTELLDAGELVDLVVETHPEMRLSR